MSEVFSFVSENSEAFLALGAASLAVFALIATKTKNKTDDKIVGWLKRLFGRSEK